MRRALNLAIASIGIGLFLGSCSTSSLTVSVLKPADITVPPRIKNIVVANRSLPAKEEMVVNVVEGILTGEGIFVDREASDQCVKGLVDLMVSSPRYSAHLHSDPNLKGTGTKVFPVALSWRQVDRICKKYGADALVTLATFDSDYIPKSKVEQKSKIVDGKKVLYDEFSERVDVYINAGWRIYDREKRRIIDEKVYRDFRYWQATGLTKDKALKKLPIMHMVLRDAGFYAGRQYGYRISPVWVRVGRSYYSKGNDDFKAAKYKVKINAWKDAAELWQRHIDDSDPKIAGRAMFNLALANEIEGDLDTAYEWAKKSYDRFPKSSTRDYVNTINTRIWEQKRLKEQLGE